MIMIFICQFVNVMYYINWFMEIEKSLLPWAKSHLIMRYTSFNVCWNQFASILLRVFASMFTSDMTCNFLFCAIFISFWYQGDGLSSVIFWKDRICLWSHFVIYFCLLGVLISQFQFQYLWLVCSYFLFLPGSVLGACTFSQTHQEK